MGKEKHFESIKEFVDWLNKNLAIVEVITKHEDKSASGFTIVYYERKQFK